jgi:hypothetical protein
MLHTTYAHVNPSDSQGLMVESQIGTLTLGASFGHNLYFKYSNGTCEPILGIYVLRTFQWFKEFFHQMCFDPYNHSLKIQKSIGTPIFKVGAHLGVCGCTLIFFMFNAFM